MTDPDHPLHPSGRRWQRSDINGVQVAHAAAEARARAGLGLASPNTLALLQARTGAPRKVCRAAMEHWAGVLATGRALDDPGIPIETAGPSWVGWNELRRALPADEYRALGGPPPPEPARPGSLEAALQTALVHSMLAVEDALLFHGPNGPPGGFPPPPPIGPIEVAMTNGHAWEEHLAAVRLRSYQLAIARGHILTIRRT